MYVYIKKKYIQIYCQMIATQESVYERSEQKSILNRIYRAPRCWHDDDPVVGVVVRPVRLICWRKDVSGIIARPIRPTSKIVYRNGWSSLWIAV